MQDKLLEHTKYHFNDIFFCPDLNNTNSKYRKPSTGMFTDAILKHNIDTINSWTIGDAITDMIAGKNVGTKTILINPKISQCNYADYIFNDLNEAINLFNTIHPNTN